MAQNARDMAVEALVQWEREHTYSNIMLDTMLSTSTLSDSDKSLATRLVYGVIERLLTIDWVLQKMCKRPLKSCHPVVRAVLRVGAYQLLFMEKIPPSAAVNEAVCSAKRMKQTAASGLINGVLRAVSSDGRAKLQSLTTDLKGQSVRHSVPLELLTAWKKAYGTETAIALAETANDAPPAVIRVNTLTTTVDKMTALLDEQSVAYSAVEGLDAALVIADPAALKVAVPSSWYYFQDTASQYACAMLGAKKGERIVDVCAAPGGKSFTTAMTMQNEGEILSCDIYKEKVQTIGKRAKAYGIAIVNATLRDAAQPPAKEEEEAFDRVICDVPCSGYGVIRRKPEIRYKSPEEFRDLPALQYRILCESAKLVKNGGVLQYSTCTLRPEENEQVVERFLKEHPDFVGQNLNIPAVFSMAGVSPSYAVTLMPHIHHTDGFFVASLRKEGGT